MSHLGEGREVEPAASRNEDGASSIEYGLLAALIAATMMFVLFILGPEVNDLYRSGCFTTVC